MIGRWPTICRLCGYSMLRSDVGGQRPIAVGADGTVVDLDCLLLLHGRMGS